MTLSLAGSECWVRVGWTMLHFLWIGSLVGLGAWASKWSLRSASAGARYLAALGWLAVLAVAPLAIATRIDVPRAPQNRSTLADPYPLEGLAQQGSRPLSAGLEPRSSEGDPVPQDGLLPASPPWHAVVTFLPWLWLFGSPLTLAWTVAGLAGAERLRKLSSPSDEGQLDALCRRLARSMKITRDVSVRFCSRIAAPVLVGIVRPVILLPPGLLTGLAPRQLEMVLLHELAHVRRHDNLVNFAQRMIESLLFFHPVVWLVSNWVRQEREYCCDELVVGRLGDRVSYAATLLAVVRKGLARDRAGVPARAAGAAISSVANNHLRSRLYRILRREEETMQISGKLGALVPVVLLMAVVLAGSFGLSIGRAEPAADSHAAAPSEAESSQSAETNGAERGDATAPRYGIVDGLHRTISPLFASEDRRDADAPIQPEPAEEEAKPPAQGAVRWVNQRNEAVWISLGREDGLKRGTTFGVYGRAKEDGSLGNEKGAIVVTRVLGDHLAEAKIERDSPRNPIMPGDRIHSPQWEGQRKAMVTARVSVKSKPADSTAALRQEVEKLRQELRRLQQERDQLFNEQVRLTDEVNALRVERRKLEEETVWPGDVRGVVLAVAGKGLVEVSIGSDDGLRKGHCLKVYREGEYERAYVGTIEVVRAQPDRSVCRVLEERSQRPIVKGDRVAPDLAAKVVALTARTVSIDAAGEITVEGTPVALRELPEVLCSAVRDPARVHLWIAAHPEVEYSRIMELITECAKAGIPKFSYVAHPDTRDTEPPAPEPTSETPKTDADTLNIDAEGQIRVNGVKTTLDVLHEALRALRDEPEGKGPAGSGVLVVVHPDANHERVVEVLDACAQAGIAGVRLTVASDEEPTRPLPVPRGEPKSPVY